MMTESTHVPCEKYGWCDGHEETATERSIAGIHTARAKVGEWDDGTPRGVAVSLCEQTDEYPEPAHIEISILASDWYDLSPNVLAAEVDAEIAFLRRAREAVEGLVATIRVDVPGVTGMPPEEFPGFSAAHADGVKAAFMDALSTLSDEELMELTMAPYHEHAEGTYEPDPDTVIGLSGEVIRARDTVPLRALPADRVDALTAHTTLAMVHSPGLVTEVLDDQTGQCYRWKSSFDMLGLRAEIYDHHEGRLALRVVSDLDDEFSDQAVFAMAQTHAALSEWLNDCGHVLQVLRGDAPSPGIREQVDGPTADAAIDMVE